MIRLQETIRHVGFLQACRPLYLRWFVWNLAAADCRPIDRSEVRMVLDFVDTVETNALCWVLRQQLLDEVLGFRLDALLDELNFMALLNVVVRFQIRSAFERRLATQNLVEDDSKRPVVACVAQVCVAERLRRQVLLSADE